LGKLAAELDRALGRRDADGIPGALIGRPLARGAGWTAEDVICTSGPDDRPYEEAHKSVRIALVVAGTFHYRSTDGSGLLTPGSLLLGNDGQCFECGHEHARGDRCVSFGYAPEYFERVAADAGVRGSIDFRVPRVPPLRALAPVAARACAGIVDDRATIPGSVWWEELCIEMAVRTLSVTGRLDRSAPPPPPYAIARVAAVVRTIEAHSDAPLTLGALAATAGVSPFHFLRTFRQVTGVTPHQYLLRARLRDAVARLLTERGHVLDIALSCGFGDVSHFNHAFRAEFGTSPRAYRRASWQALPSAGSREPERRRAFAGDSWW
jgi:AraC family transcriptional regulator